MSAEQPYVQGRETDEKFVVEEMIRNPDSDHWEKCLEFVTLSVHTKARIIAKEDKEDIIQEIMYKVRKYLPNFRFASKFKTWLYSIIGNSINDNYRAHRHSGRGPDEKLYHFFVEQLDVDDTTGSESKAIEESSVEELFERQEKIRKGVDALLDYVHLHTNIARNSLILKSVIFEGDTYVEAAKKAGCDDAVVGYVVREAQKYAREQIKRDQEKHDQTKD